MAAGIYAFKKMQHIECIVAITFIYGTHAEQYTWEFDENVETPGSSKKDVELISWESLEGTNFSAFISNATYQSQVWCSM